MNLIAARTMASTLATFKPRKETIVTSEASKYKIVAVPEQKHEI